MKQIECAICHKTSKSINGLCQHLHIHNISFKEYYDNYIEPHKEHKCIICGNECKFVNINIGYKKTCSVRCSRKAASITYKNRTGYDNPSQNPEIKNKKEKTFFTHYGVKNIFQVQSVIDKIQSNESKKRRVQSCKKFWEHASEQYKQQLKEKHKNWYESLSYDDKCAIYKKVSNTNRNKPIEEKIEIRNKMKKTNKIRYNNENYNNREKFKRTSLKKYGVINSGGSKQSIQKIKNTKLLRYGKENYVNPEKCAKTNLERYGVKTPLLLNKHKGNRISKLNKRIYKILNDNHIFFIPEFQIKTDNYSRFYDIKFNNNVILEINGDRVHANPLFFKDPNEEIRMQSYSFKVGDKWKYDNDKKILAECKGYKVKYLWENDMKKLSDIQIYNWLIENCQI